MARVAFDMVKYRGMKKMESEVFVCSLVTIVVDSLVP